MCDAGRAEIAALEAICATFADGMDELQAERDALAARYEPVAMEAENHRRKWRVLAAVRCDTRMTPTARLVTEYWLVRLNLIPQVTVFGGEAHPAEWQRGCIGAAARDLGIAELSVREGSREGVLAGYILRKEETIEHRLTHVSFKWGGGANGEAFSTTYREKQKEKARLMRERHKEARRHREAIYRERLSVYQLAARYAREIGCPAHGGAMIPPLYVSTCCWTEFSAETLAAFPFPSEKTGQEFCPLGTMANGGDHAHVHAQSPP